MTRDRLLNVAVAILIVLLFLFAFWQEGAR